MANIIEMSDTKMTLAQNPMIGFIATIIGFITPFITAIVPIVQLLVAIVGLIIGLLTVEAKWKERLYVFSCKGKRGKKENRRRSCRRASEKRKGSSRH